MNIPNPTTMHHDDLHRMGQLTDIIRQTERERDQAVAERRDLILKLRGVYNLKYRILAEHAKVSEQKIYDTLKENGLVQTRTKTP